MHSIPPNPRTSASRLMCALLLACAAALGQTNYRINWWSIDGGGGSSTGGVYAISGTIGQPDAATMSGGSYTLQGGFWGILAAVPTPGAPLLTIRRTTTQTVVVSWPSTAEGRILEATNALPRAPVAWPQIAPPYRTNGVNLEFMEPLPPGNKFYRLGKPGK